jgi:hypothetical protein
MKRSEMVEILATFLDHDYTEYADQILSLLERNGMLPPEIEVEIEGNRGFRTYKRNVWESEAPKKSKKKKAARQ